MAGDEDGAMSDLPHLTDVLAARGPVYSHLRRTPLHPYPGLSELLDADVFVKHENHHAVEAFKVRGGVNLASRLENEAPPGGVLISFETYAHVKEKVICEERGCVQVKGIARPVVTYEVLGMKQDSKDEDTPNLRLELDTESMSDDERRAAADALRSALESLEKSSNQL